MTKKNANPERSQPGRLVSQLWELARISAPLASRSAGRALACKASGLAELPVWGLPGASAGVGVFAGGRVLEGLADDLDP